MKKCSLFLLYFLSLLFFELSFKLFAGLNIFTLSSVNMILFLTAVSVFLTTITSLFNEKTNKILTHIIIFILFVVFAANYVLKTFFGFYLTLSVLHLSDQVANGFMKDAIITVIKKILPILVFSIPFVFTIIFRKKVDYRKMNIKGILVMMILFILSFIVYYSMLFYNKDEEYSVYSLVHNINNTDITVEKLGLLNADALDIYKTITKFEEKIIIDKVENNEEEITEIVYDYNNLDIDFNSILASNSSLKDMTEYFINERGTLKNEYTSYFQGKNLILFMAESFSGVAISEELTPTLYKLANNGFVFNNFYGPTILSTIGGEFQELTSLYPSGLATFRKGTNSFPMGIGTLFKNVGYSTYAYHDSFSNFQDRNVYLKNMGFDNYEGCDSNKNSMECYPWPGSDIDMIDSTYEKYINSEVPFLTYYVTVSGHGDYTSSSAYYKKYQSLVDNYYPNAKVESKAYVASQIELDRALERLIEILTENNKLDDTVIALVGDHAPYYLYEKSMSYINDISTYNRDKDIELFHSNFILYNSSMDNVVVDKVGSTMDVMPTLYNLFGLSYDSRLLMGKDLLSTEKGIAITGNSSWITDEGYYISSTNKFVQTSNNELDEDYVKDTNSLVKNKITVSNNIINKNYYKYLDIK